MKDKIVRIVTEKIKIEFTLKKGYYIQIGKLQIIIGLS